ncbi:PEP-CTERM sorting domain-containing protein [Haliea sp.]
MIKFICSAMMPFFILAALPSAHAAPMFFSDRALFDLATGGGLNFESFEADFLVSDTLPFTGFTASETGGTNGMGQLRDFPTLVPGAITDGSGGLGYDDNGSSLGNFLSFTTPITAFGLDVTTSEASTVLISGSVSSSVGLAAGVPSFWGVVETAGITSLSFSASGDPNVGFDAVSYGLAQPSVVPAPASLALLGLGIACLGWSRRKKV